MAVRQTLKISAFYAGDAARFRARKNMDLQNTVQPALDGFECKCCGAKSAVSPGTIMSAYMRELMAFESAHRACAQVAFEDAAPKTDAS